MDLTLRQYRELAEFRRQIRCFLHFSEEMARSHDVEPQQHQLLLAVHGLPEGSRPTVRELAERLCLKHHSTVELINRMAAKGLVERHTGDADAREVLVRLTTAGRSLLRSLTVAHREELERTGPELARALRRVLRKSQEAAA